MARHGWPGTPADLQTHNSLLYAYGQGGAIRFQNEQGGESSEEVRLTGNLVANNGDALLAAPLAGQGVILQPTFIAGDALRRGELVRLLPGWRLADFGVHAVYPSARHLSPKVRSFVDFLAGRFRDPPPWDQEPWSQEAA